MGDIRILEIPKWGLSMQEGTIAKWVVQEGEHFKKGQEVCVIETSKIANSLEAPFDGILRRILAPKGATLNVGAVIAVCADEKVSDEEINTYVQSLDKTPPPSSGGPAEREASQPVSSEGKAAFSLPSAPVASGHGISVQTIPQRPDAVSGSGGFSIPSSLQGYKESGDVFATPHATRMAKEHNVDLGQVTGSGPLHRISIQDIQKAVIHAGGKWPDIKNQVTKTSSGSTLDDSQVPATPLARTLAKEWKVNLNDCRVSGSRGRVCRADVEAVYNARHVNKAGYESGTDISCSETASITSVPMSGMRKTIAARLQAAKSEIPHFYLTLDADVEELQNLRTDINQKLPGIKLSINDMFIKAVASALMAVPEVNVQYDAQNQQILRFGQADISVAVAIPDGLITPIIKAADKKTLSEISTTMRDLATRAKLGKLSPDEFQGGSFCISNLGMFGIKQFDAIINAPQGAILALGASERRAVVRDDGSIVARHMVSISLSCDHRVVDGATGAKFLSSLKQFVEHPALFLV